MGSGIYDSWNGRYDTGAIAKEIDPPPVRIDDCFAIATKIVLPPQGQLHPCRLHRLSYLAAGAIVSKSNVVCRFAHQCETAIQERCAAGIGIDVVEVLAQCNARCRPSSLALDADQAAG